MRPRQGPQGRLVARNTTLNFLGQVVPLIVGFVTIPAIVAGLGPERFGILSLAWVVMMYMTVFDLGLGRAAIKFVAAAITCHETERVPQIVGTVLISQAALGLGGAIALSALTPFLIENVFGVSFDVSGEARGSFYLVGVAVPIMLVSMTWRGVLEAAQRFDLVNAVRLPSSASNFIVPFLGVALGWDLTQILLGLVLANAIFAAAYCRCAQIVFPGLRGWPRFSRLTLRRMIGYGKWITVSDVVGPALVYIDRFVLAAVTSVAVAGYYAAPFEMVSRVWIIPMSLLPTVFPILAGLGEQGDGEKIAMLVARSIKYLLLSVGAVVALLVVNAHDIISLWLGAEFSDHSATVLQVLAVGILINCVGQAAYSVIQAVGRPDLTAKFHLAELPIYCLAVWFCAANWGAAGVAVAWSLRVSVDALLLVYAGRRLAVVSLQAFIKEGIIEAIIWVGILAGAVSVVVAIESAAWLRLTSSGVIALCWGTCLWARLTSQSGAPATYLPGRELA